MGATNPLVVLDARTGDQRLTLAGLRPGVLARHLVVITPAALLAIAVSLAVTASAAACSNR